MSEILYPLVYVSPDQLRDINEESITGDDRQHRLRSILEDARGQLIDLIKLTQDDIPPKPQKTRWESLKSLLDSDPFKGEDVGARPALLVDVSNLTHTWSRDIRPLTDTSRELNSQGLRLIAVAHVNARAGEVLQLLTFPVIKPEAMPSKMDWEPTLDFLERNPWYSDGNDGDLR